MQISEHFFYSCNSNRLQKIADKSVSLIITSPPYPMIEMWDNMFCKQDPEIAIALQNGDSKQAFEKMHKLLDDVWYECDRTLKDGGIICINVGDATRTINGAFSLFSNHSRIIKVFSELGYNVLPDVLWHKPSNSPNKFMGSGMLPAGAYVTYEHEYILIFRKTGKRLFNEQEKKLRQKSAYFWEERNIWFSDIWEINGTSQTLQNSKKTRERNASFPLEIPLRLVSMYSIQGDVVMDPFAGLGTTSIACMILNRNSIYVDLDTELLREALDDKRINIDYMNAILNERIKKHDSFISQLNPEKKQKCYKNISHDFLVKTRQETSIEIQELTNIEKTSNKIICQYQKFQPKAEQQRSFSFL